MHVFGNAAPGVLALAFCVLLSGCMTPALKAKYQEAEVHQHLATPAIVSDCSDKVLKAFPNLTIAGPFALDGYAAGRVTDLEYLFPKDGLVVLVAPTTNKGLFGQENKGRAGCSYHVENGRLVFQKVHGIGTFMPKTIYVPGVVVRR